MPAPGRKSLNIEEDLHQQIKVKAANLGCTMDDLVRGALEGIVANGVRAPKDQAAAGVPKRYLPLMRKLAELLSSDDTAAIRAVGQIIDVLHGKLE